MIYTDPKTNEQMTFNLTPERKTATKKAYGKAHGLTIVTLSTLKKAYPTLNFSRAITWFRVLADALEKMDADDKITKLEAMKEFETANTEYNTRLFRPDYLSGYSVELMFKNKYVGNVGFHEDNQSYYYAPGRTGRPQIVPTAKEAIRKLLVVMGHSAAIAA